MTISSIIREKLTQGLLLQDIYNKLLIKPDRSHLMLACQGNKRKLENVKCLYNIFGHFSYFDIYSAIGHITSTPALHDIHFYQKLLENIEFDCIFVMQLIGLNNYILTTAILDTERVEMFFQDILSISCKREYYNNIFAFVYHPWGKDILHSYVGLKVYISELIISDAPSLLLDELIRLVNVDQEFKYLCSISIRTISKLEFLANGGFFDLGNFSVTRYLCNLIYRYNIKERKDTFNDSNILALVKKIIEDYSMPYTPVIPHLRSVECCLESVGPIQFPQAIFEIFGKFEETSESKYEFMLNILRNDRNGGVHANYLMLKNMPLADSIVYLEFCTDYLIAVAQTDRKRFEVIVKMFHHCNVMLNYADSRLLFCLFSLNDKKLCSYLKSHGYNQVLVETALRAFSNLI